MPRSADPFELWVTVLKTLTNLYSAIVKNFRVKVHIPLASSLDES